MSLQYAVELAFVNERDEMARAFEPVVLGARDARRYVGTSSRRRDEPLESINRGGDDVDRSAE